MRRLSKDHCILQPKKRSDETYSLRASAANLHMPLGGRKHQRRTGSYLLEPLSNSELMRSKAVARVQQIAVK